MSLVLAIYTDAFYREINLPAIDNSDYTVLLRKNDFKLKQDILLKMEIISGQWKFVQSSEYRISQDEGSFEGKNIMPGRVLLIRTLSEENIVVMTWELSGNEHLFRKFHIAAEQITVGLSKDNDICYPLQGVVSHHHAELIYEHSKCYVYDQSINGIYLNGKRVKDRTELLFGDHLNIFGLSIYYLGEFLAIRCLDKFNQLNPKTLEEISFRSDLQQDGQMSELIQSERNVHISPRSIPKIYTDVEIIENVPQKKEETQRPAWMSILPSFTMVLPMMFGYSMMSAGNMGMGLVISGGSAAVGGVWAIINYRYSLKQHHKEEIRRLKRYEEYLVQRTDCIKRKFEFNRNTMLQLYPDAISCSKYTAESAQIWARRKEHDDFLFVRLGLGKIPFQVQVKAPKIGFALTDDELQHRPERIAENFEMLQDVPVGINICEHKVIGIVSRETDPFYMNIIRSLVTQIVSNHSYIDVKMAALFNGIGKFADEWSSLRWLPHVWNEERSIRYVASEKNEINEVLFSLMKVMRTRAEQDEILHCRGNKFSPHYILFVEDPAILESQMISKYLYEKEKQLGVTTIILTESYENLPETCEIVIEKSDVFQGIYSMQGEGEKRKEVNYDFISQQQFQEMVRCMSSMRVNQVERSGNIPASLSFFDMHRIHNLDELKVLDRWRKNRTYESLKALIGQKAGGQDCYLDINEKYHGPHGLIAGTTGSGKSETLQTYILSLAINYSPQDISLFIIDFKGGGMANLFSDLPHTAGQISNLSGNQVRRAMVSIKSENRRRQRIFGEYGVNHIDAYTKLVKNGEASIPIPHLLIIIDEFAELKREEPEFMRELISVAQVGRSLGVHLILATQKPSGTVDDNIWSNTKFKLCLRVADKQDSTDMLHRPDAAYLTQAGRGYLQVGNDEIFELFQSGWSGAAYDEDNYNNGTAAVMLDLQGRSAISANQIKSDKRTKQLRKWIQKVITCVIQAKVESTGTDTSEHLASLSNAVINLLNEKEECYPPNTSNIHRLEDFIQLYLREESNLQSNAEKLIICAKQRGIRLPEQKERTQLDAVVKYLSNLAAQNGFDNKQLLWMPELPTHLALDDLEGYYETAFQVDHWQKHKNKFELKGFIGQVDDPENQMQYPLLLDFAQRGHLAVVGGITSGKSTFLQTLFYSLISTYSPEELNLYVIDYSTQMFAAFEEDAHIGGIVMEGEDDRLNKLFVLINEQIQIRRKKIRGGNFGQFIQLNGPVYPAIILAIDGYANFREKTGGKFDDILLELSRSAESYGIYIVISCAGFGGTELQTKIADNMRQSICLELNDKYRYAEALRTMHFDVLPAENCKGRGLTILEGNVLEYQTALVCIAENDYLRSEWIREKCRHMNACWNGKYAITIPEIPARPTWEIFRSLEQYHALLETGSRLPVAYYQKDASLYSIHLDTVFCYLVLGPERSGKSVFLRNVACAAKDMGGKITIFDRENGNERKTAQLSDADYIVQNTDVFKAIKELILLTNERGLRRKELLNKGLDDEEIFEEMKKQYPPVFYLIADMCQFIQLIYTNLEGIGRLNNWIENIFSKGRLLNVFFIGCATPAQLASIADKPAYIYFAEKKTGVLLASELSKQNVFSYQNIQYNQQIKRLKTGMGYATSFTEMENVDLIVVPQNKALQ